MKAGAIADYIRSLTQTQTENGHLFNLMNTAMDEISRELRVPQRTVTYESATAAADLALPADARAEGLIAVYPLSQDSAGTFISSGGPLPLYTIEDIQQINPDWSFTDPAEKANYIVYDAVSSGSYPRPVPPPDSSNLQHYRVTYAVRPDPMTTSSDEPFDGQFDSLHVVIAYRVAYLMTGNQVHMREYEKRMGAFHAKTRPAGFQARNNFFDSYVITSGGRG